MDQSHRWPVCAGALAIAAAGLAGMPATAQADPTPQSCQQWSWPGETRISFGPPGHQKTILAFNGTGTAFYGTATATKDGRQLPARGSIDEHGFVELTVSDADQELQFTGAIDNFGSASGDAHVPVGNKITDQQGRWMATTPMKCDKRAPEPAAAPQSKLGPTVDFSPILGGLNVHITDRSGVTSQCTYDADGFTRTFRLEANKSTDLKIVPAIPKLDNWDITVNCDNGTSTKTAQFF